MLRTRCAQCAAPLAHNAPRCGICKTRYCGRDCQKLHWKGGHKELCPVIKRRGGPELIYAEKKYKEAVAVAAEKCAEDTKGQTCYICTQALHWKTKEGLVRMCACRGTAGVAHVSCLAEQAKILFAEAEENNLGTDVLDERWKRWVFCGLCEQKYHGVVKCALGRACWKTYVGRPETDQIRGAAMNVLGSGLCEADLHEDALIVKEAELSTMRRFGASESDMLVVLSNLANTYNQLGRREDAIRMQRDLYSGLLRLHGESDGRTLQAAYNYARSLLQLHRSAALAELQRFEEGKSLLRKLIPVARRILGESSELTLRMRWTYALALLNTGATLEDLHEAVTTFEEIERTARRVFGGAHPFAKEIEGVLRRSREVLRARETPPPHAKQREHGKDSTEEAFKLCKLGIEYGELGDLAKKRDALERALAIQERAYGRDHTHVANTLAILGITYGELGDHAKERDMLERTLAIYESAYGPDHPLTEGCQKTLAELSSA